MAAVVVAGVVVVGTSALFPARAAASVGVVTPGLLSDPAFEQPGLGPWAVPPGQNRAVYSSPSGPVGSDYLETNSGTAPGPNVAQDVYVGPASGRSYGASVLLRSPASAPLAVTFVVWALGGSVPHELGQTQFTVGSSAWVRYRTDLDVSEVGHSYFRVQLYLDTAGQNLDMTGFTLSDSALSDAGFARGLAPWNIPNGQNRAIYSSPSAPEGQFYLETNTATTGNVYQDVATIPVVGHEYAGAVFLRSSTGAPVVVDLVMWALGGPMVEAGQSQITVSSTSWTRYYTDLDVADPGHSGLRFQVYLNTPGQNLDVAGASIQDDGVSDGGFGQSGLGPWVVSPGATWSAASGTGAPSGTTWLDTTTGSGLSSSLYQDVGTNPIVGHSYTASVSLRSDSGSPISALLVLWALGGPSANEEGQTEITVGGSWAQYSTVLDVTDPGHTDLRLQVYLNTPGQTLDVDQAAVPDASSDPPFGLPALRQGVGVYGPSSTSTLTTAVDQGWPIIAETGGLGTQQSPYTAASSVSPTPDVAAAKAISGAGRPVTWMSFWTVSAPVSGDTWYADGLAAGNYVASYLDSVSSSVKPSFVVLDPEGYGNGQTGSYPGNATDWASWARGWSTAIRSVDNALTPALYVDEYQYSAFGIAGLGLPVFVAMSPIIGNYPGSNVTFVPGGNVDGYIGFYAGCPSTSYETTMQSWGGAYDTLQFPDSGADCGP